MSLLSSSIKGSRAASVAKRGLESSLGCSYTENDDMELRGKRFEEEFRRRVSNRSTKEQNVLYWGPNGAEKRSHTCISRNISDGYVRERTSGR